MIIELGRTGGCPSKGGGQPSSQEQTVAEKCRLAEEAEQRPLRKGAAAGQSCQNTQCLRDKCLGMKRQNALLCEL